MFSLSHPLVNKTSVELNSAPNATIVPRNDAVLSIGNPLFQFQIPTMVTMTIAATRMHRSLVDFATSDQCAILHAFFKGSLTDVGLACTKNSKQVASGSRRLNRSA